MEKVNLQTKEQAIKDYLESNDSLRTIGDRYGVSQETIRRWVLKSGNKTRPRGGRNFTKKGIKVSERISLNGRKLIKLPSEQRFNSNAEWTLKEDRLLKEALLAGFTIKEVSELLGRSIISIYNRKNALTDEGYIKRGLRFKTPKGILRKKPVRAYVDPEVSEMNRLIKKYMKNNKAEDKKEISQPVTDLPKEKNKVKEKIEVKGKIDVKEKNKVKEKIEVKGKMGVEEKNDVKEKTKKEELHMITPDRRLPMNVINLEELIGIVKKYNLSILISISNTGTEIRITNCQIDYLIN